MTDFIGTTSTNATNTAYPTQYNIIGFSIANKTGGGVTASVGLLYGSTYYVLYNKSIATADSYIYIGEKIVVPPNYQIYLSVSGSCDYIFSIE